MYGALALRQSDTGESWSVISIAIWSGGGIRENIPHKVTYAIHKPERQRVVKVSVCCAECPYPKYEPLDDDRKYKVLTNHFLYTGGDGYTMLKQDDVKVCWLGTLYITVYRITNPRTNHSVFYSRPIL